MSLFDKFKMKSSGGKEPGLQGSGFGSYHHLFPKRQLFVPRCEYPLWDHDWERCGQQRREFRQIKDNGCQRHVTRHIFLVRHGQYREDLGPYDDQQVLTDKGRQQAKKTGQFLAEIVQKNNLSTRVCATRLLSCSNLIRAKETADIIYNEIEYMKLQHNSNKTGEEEKWKPLERFEPDPLLEEGRPCHYIPSTAPVTDELINKIDRDHIRCEEAFRKYIGHSKWLEEHQQITLKPTKEADTEHTTIEREHEYQIIVAHANIIRYMVCRALQLPPEAWLRMSLFNGSVTYLVVHADGTVTLRFLGETSFMGYDLVTYNLYEGFNWDSYEYHETTANEKRMQDEENENDNEEKYKKDDVEEK